MSLPNIAALAAICIFSLPPALFAADCSGPWQKIPGYKRSMGTPCRALGLDTHKGTCRPGDRYETLCDDAAGGLYRTCQGSRKCSRTLPGGVECTGWDFVYDRPCPEGYVNRDCEGHCEQVRDSRPCRNWDFIYDRPCPEGYRNKDCQGACEPVSWLNQDATGKRKR